MMAAAETLHSTGPAASLQDQTLLVFARLMEGGQEAEETCRDLDMLTKLLNEDFESQKMDKAYDSICKVIDNDCVDTILCYLDMRQPDGVRGHAALATSAFLKAAGDPDNAEPFSALGAIVAVGSVLAAASVIRMEPPVNGYTLNRVGIRIDQVWSLPPINELSNGLENMLLES